MRPAAFKPAKVSEYLSPPPCLLVIDRSGSIRATKLSADLHGTWIAPILDDREDGELEPLLGSELHWSLLAGTPSPFRIVN